MEKQSSPVQTQSPRFIKLLPGTLELNEWPCIIQPEEVHIALGWKGASFLLQPPCPLLGCP